MPDPVALNARRRAFRNRATKQVHKAGQACAALQLLASQYKGHATESDAVAILDALFACVDEVRHAFEGREPAAVEVKW